MLMGQPAEESRTEVRKRIKTTFVQVRKAIKREEKNEIEKKS